MPLWTFYLFYFARSENTIYFKVSGTTAIYFGSGIISQNDIRAAGSYGVFTTIQVLEGPTGFGEKALYKCEKLRELILPSSFQKVSGTVFELCYKLETFSIPSNNSYLYTDTKAIYNFDKTILYKVGTALTSYSILGSTEILDEGCFQQSNIHTLAIPKNVKQICGNCFNSVSIQIIEFEPGSALTEIIKSSFWWQTAKTVHIPPSVKTIHNEAFSNGYSTSIIFDDIDNSQLTTLGEGSFAGLRCTEIKLPPKITKIPKNCFKDSIYLTTINIPSQCADIDMTAFSGCSKIWTITISESNTHFKYNSEGSLVDSSEARMYLASSEESSITIRSTIQEIASSVLQSRINIKTLIVDEQNPNFANYDNLLYNKNYNILYAFPGGVVKASAHPNLKSISNDAANGVLIEEFICSHCQSLTSIGESAFKLSKIKSICFPSSLSILSGNSFKECHELKNVTFMDNSALKTIQGSTFSNCISLNYVEIPTGLTAIEKAAFNSCSALRTFIIPRDSKLGTIGDLSFQNSGLTHFEIPSLCHCVGYQSFEGCSKAVIDFSRANSLETIGNYAFSSCVSIQSVYLPTTLTKLDSYAFQNCLSLSSVTFAKPSQITSFGSGAFQNCPNLTRFEIPASFNTLEPSIFFNCTSLRDITVDSNMFVSIGSIIYNSDKTKLILCGGGVQKAPIEEGISEITGNAFYCCSVLQSVTFPANCYVSVIRENTFGYCTSLTDVTIPPSVTTLERNSFIGCSSLETIEFKQGSIMRTIGFGTFSNCVSLFKVTFGEGSILDDISSEAFSGCTNLEIFDFPKTVTKIGSKAFAGASIKTVSFPSDSIITNLPSNAFGSMPKLTYFTFPPSITSFDVNLFYDSTLLKSIEFPINSKIKSISDYAFVCIKSIETVTFSPSIQTIGVSAFDGLLNLSHIYSNSFYEVKDRAFAETNLSEVNIKTATKLGSEVFKGCQNLRKIDLNENLNTIPVGCFEQCISLESFPFFNNITTISNRAFASTGLVSASLPESVSEFGDYSFCNCKRLESVTIEAESVKLGASLFADCHALKTIKFCGTSVVSSDIGRPPSAAFIFVPFYFKGSVICGLPVVRRLDDNCGLLASIIEESQYTDNSMLFVATIIGDTE